MADEPGADEFWVILGQNLVVFGQERKKVNVLTRRRHISAAYRLVLKMYVFRFLFPPMFDNDFSH